jgi:hypothetical protein
MYNNEITLTNWELKPVLGDWCIWGRVTEDKTGRYKNQDWICIPLETVDFKRNIAKSANYTFIL